MWSDLATVLPERERLLALALDSARMVAWTWDPVQDRVETFGDLPGIYGVAAVEYAEKGFGLIHVEDVERHRATVNQAISNGSAYWSEFRVIRPDNGQTIWIEERGQPVLDADGKLVKLAGIVMDITGRRQNEAALGAAQRAAERAAERTVGLQGVTAALTPALTAGEVINVILEQSAAALGARSAGIYVLEDNRQWLSLAGSLGYPEAIREGVQRLPLDGDMPGAEVFRTHQPCWLCSREDFNARYPKLLDTRAVSGNEALAVIPLLSHTQALGVLALSFAEPRDFEPDERDFLTALAGQCALALERAQLYEAEREARRLAQRAADRTTRLQAVTAGLARALTQDEVFEVAVREGVAAIGASAGGVSVVSEDGQWLEFGYQLGDESPRVEAYARQPLAAHSAGPDAARSGEAIWLESNDEWLARYPEMADLRGGVPFQSIAVLPLNGRERVLGIIAFSFVQAHAFAPDEREFLWTLARQCTQALERARLYSGERQARAQAEAAQQHLALLSEAGARLAASLDIEATLQTVTLLLLPRLGDACLIYRLDEGRPRLVASAQVDERKAHWIAELNRLHRPQLDDERSLLSRVLRTGQPVVMPELPQVPRPADSDDPLWEAVAAMGPVSVLGAPMIARGRVLGAIMLMMAESGRHYREADLPLVEELAGRAALALDNAGLYETAQQLNAELEQRVQARTGELLASEARFHSLVNSVQDYAIFMLDPEGRVVSWNPGAQRIKGYAPQEIIGQHFSRFYTPEDVRQGWPGRGLVQAARVGRFEAEGWRVRKDGSRFWAHVVISAVRNEAGELMGFAKVTQDLTERRQAEALVRESERSLAEAQHLARLGSWHWDVGANRVTWSDEMYRIYGLALQAEPVTYERFLDFVHPEDRDLVHTAISSALRDYQPFAFDYRIVRADGGVRTLHAQGEVMLDDLGHLTALTGTGQDITERKQIEDEVRRSREQLRRLSAHLERAREEERARIAREIHDELGGMLTGLKMDVAQLRRSGGKLEPRALQTLEAFSSAIDRAVQTVRRIASELRPAILDDFGVLAAMEWQLGEFQRRSGLECQWTCGTEELELPPETAIALFRLFQESLTNIARHAQATRVEVHVAVTGQWLVLQVADNGRGITREEALGSKSLGLTGMRERTALLGGKLEIEGQPGQGTTVRVELPVGKAESE